MAAVNAERVLEQLKNAVNLTASLPVTERNTEAVRTLWGELLNRRFLLAYPGKSGSVQKEGVLLGVAVIDGNRYGLQFRVPKGQRPDKYRTPKVPAADIETIVYVGDL